MMVTLTLGYFLSKEVIEFYLKDEKISKENDREKGLWKNRFETLRDSHNLEIVRLEDDVERSKEGLKEKKSTNNITIKAKAKEAQRIKVKEPRMKKVINWKEEK